MARKQLTIVIVLWLSVLHLASCLVDQTIEAQARGKVTLPCQAPGKFTVDAVKWIRTGHKEHVFMKRDGHIVTRDQDQSFAPRVHLVDPEMKDGDLSVTIADVTSKDTGVYECYCSAATGLKLIRRINLTVTDPAPGKFIDRNTAPGKPHGHLVLIGVLSVVVVVVVVGVVVGIVAIYRKCKCQKSDQSAGYSKCERQEETGV